MRLILFAYFLVEVLAFIGVAHFIGIGWAFLAVFALMLLGGLAANVALRNSLRAAAEGRSSLTALAGDSAILVAGWVLTIIPGFVSSLVGLFMVFGPTRALLRRGLTARARRAVEDFGVRAYAASPISRVRTSYGTFTTDPSPRAETIDADELERLFRMDAVDPDDKDGPKP
ncbi:FxsA family protein [Corynebacterium liangguodongii]|uniref:FxsA n=1 Tax=Corynebacterium liangguodongii TaxID=2079535 RepID=A0A2S0WDY8_9CORY|nr:FxsA family protein [Corynebacterium liangguodongii]AWB83993.1 FxsA [Corynebacterium liangguodongii]PWC00005.1 FxsA [Corynebacterium liangguodongii]